MAPAMSACADWGAPCPRMWLLSGLRFRMGIAKGWHDQEGTGQMSGEGQGRRRPAPETAKDILGQIDTALGRIGRARAVAESAGFTHTVAALQEAERGIEST